MPMRIIRPLARLTLALWGLGTLAALVLTLSLNPLAQPIIDRTPAQIRMAAERAMHRKVTADWLIPRLEAAIVADDPDRVAGYMSLAADYTVTLPNDLHTRAQRVVAAHQGWIATAQECGACMIDIAQCPKLSLIGACALPFELSPAGDVNELRRQGGHWLQGDPVDTLSTTLAALGLMATVASIPSLGTTVPIKAGTTALRLARRADALTPGLTADLARNAREATDAAKHLPSVPTTLPTALSRLEAIAADSAKITKTVGPAQTLDILRLADNSADLRRLTRLSEAIGPNTARTLDVLGKTRSLRLLTRISNAALLMLTLILALAAQLGALLTTISTIFLKRLLRQIAR